MHSWLAYVEDVNLTLLTQAKGLSLKEKSRKSEQVPLIKSLLSPATTPWRPQ